MEAMAVLLTPIMFPAVAVVVQGQQALVEMEMYQAAEQQDQEAVVPVEQGIR